jgi:hypothetical protein
MTPDAPAARLLEPAPNDCTAPREFPGERLLPWCRSASPTTAFRRLPIAKSEISRSGISNSEIAKSAVAGPSPVPCVRKPRCYQLRGSRPVPDDHAVKKSARCDLLHKRPGRLALNLRNGRENTPIVRSAERHRHRLRLDRHRRRGRPDRADLSPFDLIQRRGGGSDVDRPWNGYARAAKGSVRAAISPILYRETGGRRPTSAKSRQASMLRIDGILNTHCVNRA